MTTTMMMMVQSFGALFAVVAAIRASSATSSSPNKTYTVLGVSSNCTSEQMTVRLELSRNFRGIVYAKGFPLEKGCRSVGSGRDFVDVTLATSGCGVRLSSLNDDDLSVTVTLNIQTDRFLQQISDMEVTSTCKLTPDDMVHATRSEPGRHASRTGRYRTDAADGPRDDSAVRSVRSWMEIEGISDGGTSGRVAVGEQTLLLVKSLLPGEMSANVVDCYAHDGTKEASQRLLDEFGCPLDESIMPSMETMRYDEGNEMEWEEGEDAMRGRGPDSSEAFASTGKAKERRVEKGRSAKDSAGGRGTNVQLVPEGSDASTGDAKARMHIVGTVFSAFKFPDTSKLHVKCVLQICRHVCPLVPCEKGSGNSLTAHNRTSKSVKSTDFSSVVDRIEVFNSVEVVAPGIDSEGYTSPEDANVARRPSDERTFCLSATKMAFSFAILGAVFLCGVLAALWTVMRNQMRKMNKSYGSSEQILVVRDSPFNVSRSRNKPFTNWSYT